MARVADMATVQKSLASLCRHGHEKYRDERGVEPYASQDRESIEVGTTHASGAALSFDSIALVSS